MKKLCIFLVLIALLVVSAGCVQNEEDTLGEPSIDIPTPGEPRVDFNSFEDFISYANDTENQTVPVAPEAVIDFSSIVTAYDSLEISCVDSCDTATCYGIEYDGSFAISVWYYSTPEKASRSFDDHIRNEEKNEIPYNSINDFENLEPRKKLVYASIDDVELVYWLRYTNYYSNERTVGLLRLVMENFVITIQRIGVDAYDESYGEIITSLNPDYGATDDTVIAMLNRIKALIPTGDEANGVQADASADESFDANDTPDKENADVTDTASANDGAATDEPSYVGETGGETYYEDEEYVYGEEYEYTVIPGISPDWKPNANGKYPLKDGYTRAEMTLILACEIELDWGDMTFEEMSKVEFRLIEEEENEE